MDIIKQIEQICIETDNSWFLTHDFTKIALCDLQLKEQFEKEDIFDFDERECVCNKSKREDFCVSCMSLFDYERECICKREDLCVSCMIETERSDILDKLEIYKLNNYDYEKYVYSKSKWIISSEIDGEIPGFILINCNNEFDKFTHELVFACVRHKHRNKGILKNMMKSIPKKWDIWLEANSNDIENIENVWEKCGFSFHKTIRGMHLIYKKMGI
jgi:hypothetical protein